MSDRQWFHGARFGLFIHWGIYSLLGRGEQVLFREHLRPSEYRRLAARFRPKRFDPSEWASCARDAGMRYAVMTTKHHDGFCLFDTATTDFSSVRQAARRDFVADYVRAFRRAGLRVGLYFSLADWGFPAYFLGPKKDPAGFRAFIETVHAQVRELCTQYGRIDVLWFDGEWPHSVEAWQSRRLERMIRALQPGILINNRLFKRAPGTGDFDTPEQEIIASERPWEACLTSTHRWWGWHAGDTLWKTPREIVLHLCKVADGGGNLLLNVGPKADGTFPAPFVRAVRRVGAWLRRYGEAVYDTGRSPFETSSVGFLTTADRAVYLLPAFWPGETIHLRGLKTPVRSARLLGHSAKVRVTRDGEHLALAGLPRRPPDPLCAVLKLELDGPVEVYPWARLRGWGDDMAVFAGWAKE